jgi:hypothetical protein
VELILCPSDLSLIRRRLATLLPSSSPSMLCEGFAHGLGHASHASALVALGARSMPLNRPVPFSPARFADRLDEMRYPDAARLVIEALELCGVVAEGPGSREHFPEAVFKMREGRCGQLQELARSDLTGVEKFSAMAGTLDWRMEQSGLLLDWYCNWGQRFGLRLNRGLAASFQRHADLDPDMTGFLCEAMAALDRVPLVQQRGGPNGSPVHSGDHQRLSPRGDDTTFDRLKWLEAAYMALRPRIQAFYDKVARRWDDDDDPLFMEPSWMVRSPGSAPRVQDHPRYPGITVGLTPHARRCRFTLADVSGGGDIDRRVASGVVAFAMWRSGVPEAQLEAFGIAAYYLCVDLSELLADWVNLDGNGGNERSRQVLRQLCEPADPHSRTYS